MAQTTMCDDQPSTEVALSDCPYGCKVYKCEFCGEERVVHLQIYGCTGGILNGYEDPHRV